MRVVFLGGLIVGTSALAEEDKFSPDSIGGAIDAKTKNGPNPGLGRPKHPGWL